MVFIKKIAMTQITTERGMGKVSKMEAPIIKYEGSNYQRWRLQIWRLKIVNNLATNPPFFLPC